MSSFEPTDIWPFHFRGFDESLAEASGELPEKVHFYLSNGLDLCLVGDYIEYFGIQITGRK